MTIHQNSAPEGITRIVIFDTNAYRNLPFGLSCVKAKEFARRLADAEQAASTKALVNPFVLWELVSHLADTHDPAYPKCMSAIVALVEHTRQACDDAGGICRIADGETELCRQLFQRLPPNAEQNSANLSKLASYVWKEAPLLSAPNAQANFRTFRAAMEEREMKWLDHVEAMLSRFRSIDDFAGTLEEQKSEIKKRRDYLKGAGFVRDMAVGKAMSIAALLGLTPLQDEIKAAGDLMERNFSTSLKLMQKTLANWFDAPEMNLRNPEKRRANFIWDTAICYGIGADRAVGNAKILFVTSENAICEAAEDAGCGDCVMKLTEYLKSVLPTKS